MDEKKLSEFQEMFNKIKDEHGFTPDENFEETFSEIFGDILKDLDTEMIESLKVKTIEYKKLHKDAVDPSYVFSGDSGFDLYSVEDLTIPPFGRSLVSTGLSVKFDEGFELQIRPKSGLALKEGLTVLNTPGTVDCGYLGELKVIMYNSNSVSYQIKKGMKIAQAVLCPVMNGKFVKFNEITDLGNSARGDGGFGSTGTNK